MQELHYKELLKSQLLGQVQLLGIKHHHHLKLHYQALQKEEYSHLDKREDTIIGSAEFFEP